MRFCPRWDHFGTHFWSTPEPLWDHYGAESTGGHIEFRCGSGPLMAHFGTRDCPLFAPLWTSLGPPLMKICSTTQYTFLQNLYSVFENSCTAFLKKTQYRNHILGITTHYTFGTNLILQKRKNAARFLRRLRTAFPQQSRMQYPFPVITKYFSLFLLQIIFLQNQD